MQRKPIPEELRLDLEEMRASMAIEGFHLSDRTLDEVAQAYLSDPMLARLRELKEKADKEGVSFSELVAEELGLDLADEGEPQ